VVSSSIYLSFFLSFFPRLIPAVPDWMFTVSYFHTWCGVSANLGCRSETCCTRLAEKIGCRLRVAKISASGHHLTTLSGCIFAIKALSTIGKSLLNSNVSPTCPYNMVNFGPLTAEIGLPVWGTPAHFNGFSVLAALLHGTLVVGVSQTFRR